MLCFLINVCHHHHHDLVPVHICHAFLTVSGSKKERAHAAMVDMGPAVLNGGVSTLIAFILLVSSDSHVFTSFFKIFLLVVLFGVRGFAVS